MKWTKQLRRGSILVVVLVTLMVTSIALVLFLEKASDDLLLEIREADARRLRAEAYSALETTLAVLVDFKTVNGALRSPAEGWSDPLGWVAYELPEDMTIRVEFQDESGKLSLPRATETNLTDLFLAWELPQADAERLADALLHWMSHEHVLSSGYTPSYDLDSLEISPPGRSLRTWSELAAIDVIRELFFEADGRPNALLKRFTDSLSLFNFNQTNINAATPDVLTLMGFEPTDQTRISYYLQGQGAYLSKGPGWFSSTAEISSIAGKAPQGLNPGTEIRALRIVVTVQEGRSLFRLNTLIATGNNSAGPVTTKATAEDSRTKGTEENSTAQVTKTGARSSSGSTRTRTTASSSSATNTSINYPFVILEMRENDEIATPPADPSASP